MNCLVLGGAGFIGSHIVDALVAAGHDVRVFDLPNVGLGNIAAHVGRVEVVSGDFCNASDISRALSDMDVVFHLISTTLPDPSNENPAYDVESNLVSSLNLLRTAVEKRVKKIIFASSGGTVYGHPRMLPIPETHPTHPICSYGICKLAVEKYLALYHHLHGLDYAVLRMGNPYGPRQRIDAVQGALAVFLGNVLRGRSITIWGDGSVARDYFFVKDLSDAYLRAMDAGGEHRVFNIGGGRSYTLSELVEAVGRATGCDPRVVYTPGRKMDVPINRLDISRAGKYLGWRPKTSLEEGLSATVAALRKQLGNTIFLP